jgi:hypothetical protein
MVIQTSRERANGLAGAASSRDVAAVPQQKMRHVDTLREAISHRLRPSSGRWRLTAAALAAAAVAAGLIARTGNHKEAAGRHERNQSGFYVTSGSPGTRRGRGASAPPAQATPAPRGRPVSVSIDVKQPGAAVPTDFLGLSFEAAAIPRIAAYAQGGNLAGLLRSLGDGTIRFGGVSADTQVTWSEGATLPRWASGAISSHDLAGLASLVRQTGWGVLLTVNLGHYDPAAAAREAAAAHALLGEKLAGIEIGNESDRFFRKGLRGPDWSFAAYRSQFEVYRAAIARAAPGVPIAGPDASSGEPVLPWLRASAALRPALLTDHYYPLTSCGYTPVVSELLSPVVRADESSMLSSLRAIQRSSAIPLRIDETNDISCKGQAGVSNTFASALWAADYTARAMAAGIRGLDFHDLIGLPGAYSPLVATANGLHANPEWYALLMARPLQGSKPLQTTVRSAANLTARAFLSAGGVVRLVLVNFDPPSAAPLLVRLRVPGRFAGGSILRLTGPSPYATSQVKLGGREVTASGTWSARPPLPGVYDRGGSLALAVPPSSAALVTLEPTL